MYQLIQGGGGPTCCRIFSWGAGGEGGDGGGGDGGGYAKGSIGLGRVIGVEPNVSFLSMSTGGADGDGEGEDGGLLILGVVDSRRFLCGTCTHRPRPVVSSTTRYQCTFCSITTCYQKCDICPSTFEHKVWHLPSKLLHDGQIAISCLFRFSKTQLICPVS